MEFEAETKDGELIVKPNVVKKTNAAGGTDITLHMPTMPVIEEAKKAYLKEVLDGKRSIQ